MVKTDDNKFMKRCLELASKAEGLTYPNPMVGSVIVNNGTIIGEGFHLKSGGPHAEVIAINAVSDKSKLKTSGCEVITGVLEKECRRLNRRFFTFNEKKRPYITLKWAQSADGYLDMIRPEGYDPGPNWITGNPERVLVHKWRASEQAILVGAGTFRADNPKLNVREWSGPQPLRIILSSSGTIGNEFSVNETNGRVVVFTHNKGISYSGATKVELDEKVPSSNQIVEYLYNRGIQSLFIEGGAEVLNHFMSTDLWNEARIFTGENYFKGGVKAPVIPGALLSRKGFSNSSLEIYLRE